jgi:hypothetical protein
VLGWQEQLAVDRKLWQVGGIADDVEVIGGIGGGNFEIQSLAGSIGGGENNILVAKSQVVILLRLLFFGGRSG